MARLYLVATPIGNLEDITLRALRLLREVALIAAEDTRTTRRLLTHYGIATPLVSYNDHNKASRIPYLLSRLQAGDDVALVSEAGMPAISDPGVDLVQAATAAGVTVVPLPGPSAIIAALAASGLPTRHFVYLGFPPRRRGERQRLFRALAEREETIVLFESPHRLRETLADLLATLGDRPVAVCRELTKLYEEVFRGALSEALAHFQEPRGEFTLVVAGNQEARGPGTLEAENQLQAAAAELSRLRAEGLRAKQAVAQVAERYNLPHREVYRLWLGLAATE